MPVVVGLSLVKFSLPYIDQPPAFWNELADDYGSHIADIYFPMTAQIVPSGRPIQPNKFIQSFLSDVDLPKTVLVNPIVLPRPVEELEDTIINELAHLNEEYGVNRVAVSSLQLCKSIKSNLGAYHVSASVLMKINSPEQITYVEDLVDGITLDTAVVRDLGTIRAIRDSYSGEIKLIVNEGCLAGCVFRTQHFYEMTCDLPYPESLCKELLEKEPWLRIKSAWILPQHLHFYKGLYDIIKLAGRVTLRDPERFLEVFRAYLEEKPLPADKIGSGPAGLVDDIPVSEEFFLTTITCDKNCMRCDVCKKYYDRHSNHTL